MDLQIYGTREFENGVIKHRPTKKYGKGIACSICEVSAYDVLMIPGRSECPSNWIKEYSGYLMGSRYQIKQCVDKGMDTVLRNEFDIKDRDNWKFSFLQCKDTSTCLNAYPLECTVCSTPKNVTGAVYTQWGRQECTKGQNLVYSGLLVSGGHPGWFEKHQCLPSTLSKPIKPGPYHTIVLVFARYRDGNKAIPCSVCLSENKVSSVMIPERSECPGDLHQEYRGVLAGDADMNCFDKDPLYHLKTVTLSSTSVAVISTDYLQPSSFSAKFRTSSQTSALINSPCVLCTFSQKQSKAVFTRFGRTSCPSGIPTLYTGFVAGRNYKLFCFPKRDFQKSDFSHVSKGALATLSATLYYAQSHVISLKALTKVLRKKVPCTVCAAAVSTFTLFGTHLCPNSFRAAYKGYAFSAVRHTFCIDKNPEAYSDDEFYSITHSHLYPVKANCFTLPCPPHIESFILCVQCVASEISY
ncbi:uncharacterized protein [Oscarella lobularis]|uniref:uncharacterized protein isoform X2 n=1 Tax=Oscarella lobularis TaxID=121494 RepID=UPI00331359FF